MYQDLLDQARWLAQVEPRRPKQANLRRTVSATYYALFHYLIEEAVRQQLGSHHATRPYRHVISRAYSHVTMKAACRSFGGGSLKREIATSLSSPETNGYTIPTAIQDLAATFAELQEKRHLADYDLSKMWGRLEVLALIDQVETAITAFTQLPDSADRRFFLACLWAWRDLTHR